MKAPFAELLKSLQSVFRLESMRNEKYTYTEVQQLKEALDHYENSNKQSFIILLKTIRGALPYIEKWRVDFNLFNNKFSMQ